MEARQGVAVATSDPAFAQAVSHALAGVLHSGGGGGAQIVKTSKVGQDLVRDLMRGLVLVVDAELEEPEAGRRLYLNDELHQVAAAFRDYPDKLPITRFMARVREVAAGFNAPTCAVVVACADGPSDSFTQLMLSCGADWVWSSRSQFQQFEAVVKQLNDLKVEHARENSADARKRIIVLENASNDIRRLRGLLKQHFELSIVGTNVNSASKIVVTADDAWVHFNEKGPFDAAIVDLALNREDEEVAEKLLSSEQSAIDDFLKGKGRSKVSSYLQGIRFVRRVLDAGYDIPICVLSNFTRTPTMNRLRTELGPMSRNVIFKTKEAKSYRDLREHLHQQLLGFMA